MYPATLFACTTVEMHSPNASDMKIMFLRLYNYLQEQKIEGLMMKMTRPVFLIEHLGTKHVVDKFAMCIWVTQDDTVLTIRTINIMDDIFRL